MNAKQSAGRRTIFSINPDDEERYYCVDDFSFSSDDVLGAFTELVGDLDREVLREFLVDNWPLQYGEGVNQMISDGYLPKGIKSEMKRLRGLYNDELFLALCKYPLDSHSYFTDLFAGGDPECDSMLQDVAEFINSQ